ncbi:carbohydrate esterase family 1 protein [Patellaria atrata CBS 101060]|uniref:Carboxylic ester hydrolase n=1 Tax=Patellaria atrata CBS 101060 TaxID=1346257 RepID=A0A9P4SIH9_9PEZI|nr:carbohydrate esterase family 1 protein [Patellaria atrata CBS 101060]
MLLSNLGSLLTLISAASAAQLTQVQGYGAGRAQMWIYVPDKVVPNPPLVVAIHSCQSSAQSYFTNSKIPWKQGSDAKGYITLWPSSPNSGTCWDVSSKSSLTHNGGGDSNAIANMITYAIQKYNVNATRVYVTGGSSGAMMSNVLAATYPSLMSAVSLYSGVPANCFVSSSNQVAAWNNDCSGGRSQKTPAQWAQDVFNMYPGYTGARPKMQIWHGSADGTLSPNNYQETIDQWTGVFNVSATVPTREVKDTPERGYTTRDFGEMVQGIWAQGVGHSVPSHLSVSEAWFGL